MRVRANLFAIALFANVRMSRALGALPGAAAFRVVSYNVLSSHLAQPDHFTRCDPADLDASTRLGRVKAKLEREVDAGAIICLQEVSNDWAGELHALFARRGYHFVTGLYGRPFNGYMGVGLAWPVDRFEAVDVKIERVADHLPRPNPPPQTPEQKLRILDAPRDLIGLARRGVTSALRWAFANPTGANERPARQNNSDSTSSTPNLSKEKRIIGRTFRDRLFGAGLFGKSAETEKPAVSDVYGESRRRFNQMVFARLRTKGKWRQQQRQEGAGNVVINGSGNLNGDSSLNGASSSSSSIGSGSINGDVGSSSVNNNNNCDDEGRVVCVGTYHMPCAFKEPHVMVIHASLAAQIMAKLSGDDPQVLAGDFNFTPGSPPYRIYTEGKLEEGSSEIPPPLLEFSDGFSDRLRKSEAVRGEERGQTNSAGEKNQNSVKDAAASGSSFTSVLWEPRVPVRLMSAYAQVEGGEPDFTNNAQVRDNQPFIDTLDYVFHTPDLAPVSVVPLQRRDQIKKPFPTPEEPSDHVLIGADFEWASVPVPEVREGGIASSAAAADYREVVTNNELEINVNLRRLFGEGGTVSL